MSLRKRKFCLFFYRSIQRQFHFNFFYFIIALKIRNNKICKIKHF